MTSARSLLAALPALPVLLGLAGCTADQAAADARPRVVVTVAPLTSIVAAVGGDRVRIDGLVPEGVNSHTYEPPPSAARLLSRCDVVFVNGLKLDESSAELARANAPRGCAVVPLGDRVLPPKDYVFDFSFPEQDGRPNPHLWTDPTYALRYAEVVRDVLAAESPADRSAFDANLAAFRAKVGELDRAVRAATATVPERHRALLTYHDGYAYFARSYGWRVAGAIQPANFEDPTPREVVALIRQIRASGVPAIFGSEVFPSRVLETIGRETGVRYVDTLRDDDLLGRPGEAEHSWLGLMRYDFATMVAALGGDATALRAVSLTGLPADLARYPQ